MPCQYSLVNHDSLVDVVPRRMKLSSADGVPVGSNARPIFVNHNWKRLDNNFVLNIDILIAIFGCLE